MFYLTQHWYLMTDGHDTPVTTTYKTDRHDKWIIVESGFNPTRNNIRYYVRLQHNQPISNDHVPSVYTESCRMKAIWSLLQILLQL